MGRGYDLIQRFVSRINAGVPASELERDLKNVRFPEIRNGDTILYLPGRDLNRAFTDVEVISAHDDQLVVKSAQAYAFSYNPFSREVCFKSTGELDQIQHIPKFNRDCWYRLEQQAS